MRCVGFDCAEIGKCRGARTCGLRSTNIQTCTVVCEKLFSHFSSPADSATARPRRGCGYLTAVHKPSRKRSTTQSQKQQLPSTTPTPPAPGAHPGPAPHLTLKRKQRHHYAPTGRLWDHPSLRGRSRAHNVQHHRKKRIPTTVNPHSTPIKLIRGRDSTLPLSLLCVCEVRFLHGTRDRSSAPHKHACSPVPGSTRSARERRPRALGRRMD